MILMNLESRPVMFEDIARQVLAIGHRKLPATFIQEIGEFINIKYLVVRMDFIYSIYKAVLVYHFLF